MDALAGDIDGLICTADGEGEGDGAATPEIDIIIAAPSRTISGVHGVAPQNCPAGPFCVTTAHCVTAAAPHGRVTLQ